MIENTLFRVDSNLGNVNKTTKDRPGSWRAIFWSRTDSTGGGDCSALGPVLAMIENTYFRLGSNLGNVKKTTKDPPFGGPVSECCHRGSVVTAVAYARISDAPPATADVINLRFTNASAPSSTACSSIRESASALASTSMSE